MITLETAKSHLRLDSDDESLYLQSLIEAAALYVTSITGIANDDDAPPTYDICVLLLVGHWFNVREAASEVDYRKVPYAFGMLLQSLRPGGSLI